MEFIIKIIKSSMFFFFRKSKNCIFYNQQKFRDLSPTVTVCNRQPQSVSMVNYYYYLLLIILFIPLRTSCTLRLRSKSSAEIDPSIATWNRIFLESKRVYRTQPAGFMNDHHGQGAGKRLRQISETPSSRGGDWTTFEVWPMRILGSRRWYIIRVVFLSVSMCAPIMRNENLF